MILELDISLIDKIGNLNLNQLVFLTLVFDNNQKSNQGILTIVSLVSDTEIQELIDRELIHKEITEKGTVYKVTDKFISFTKDDKDLFDEFFEIYPTQVTRPDGTTEFLKKNKTNCRKKYSSVLGRGKAKRELRHQHILKCLNHDIYDKMSTGKIGYMKTMWKWLTTAEWENSEEQMKSNEQTSNTQLYGQRLL